MSNNSSTLDLDERARRRVYAVQRVRVTMACAFREVEVSIRTEAPTNPDRQVVILWRSELSNILKLDKLMTKATAMARACCGGGS